MSDSENKKKARIVEFAAGRMMKDEYKVCTYFFKCFLRENASFSFRPRKNDYLDVERLNFHQTTISELFEIHARFLIISSPRNSSSWRNVKLKTRKKLKSKKSKQLKHQQQLKLLQQHRRQHQLLQQLRRHHNQQHRPRLVSYHHSFFVFDVLRRMAHNLWVINITH